MDLTGLYRDNNITIHKGKGCRLEKTFFYSLLLLANNPDFREPYDSCIQKKEKTNGRREQTCKIYALCDR